jgi:hypothetical protein
MRRLSFVIGSFILLASAFGQDTLPKFTVKNLGNDREGNASIVISWVNNFDSLLQISIQTSHDSLRNYRTLVSLTDPNAKLNGFADKKAPNDHMFYRLFVVKKTGEYFFTSVKKPFLDTARTVTRLESYVVRKTDGRYSDTSSTTNPVVIRKPEFVPSFYVYTNREGYVYINLPDADKKKYRIRFFEEDESFLFEVKNIRQTGLTLDKTNFLHSGWFRFELYNDDALVEKHRLYIDKEF